MILQVAPGDVPQVLAAAKAKKAEAAVIGEITPHDKAVFAYEDRVVATVPNSPSREVLQSLEG